MNSWRNRTNRLMFYRRYSIFLAMPTRYMLALLLQCNLLGHHNFESAIHPLLNIALMPWNMIQFAIFFRKVEWWSVVVILFVRLRESDNHHLVLFWNRAFQFFKVPFSLSQLLINNLGLSIIFIFLADCKKLL